MWSTILCAMLTIPIWSSIHQQASAQELVYVEGGSFNMGTTDSSFFAGHQRALHRVAVQSFYMNSTEITNSDFCQSQDT